MTYVALTPLASDSPSIFPVQAQDNFTRLEQIIGADHQFNNTAQANDGYHNLIHMTLQAPTGALANVGRLYTKVVFGVVGLFYMDDAGTEYQITPGIIKITGTASLASGASLLIYPDLGFDYTAVAMVYVNNTLNYTSQVLLKSGVLASANIYSFSDPTIFLEYKQTVPPIPVSLTDLYITNSFSVGPRDVVWSLTINRTT